MVLLIVESRTGVMVSGPDITTRGVTSSELEAELVDLARASVEQRILELAPATLLDWEEAKDEIRLAARRAHKQNSGTQADCANHHPHYLRESGVPTDTGHRHRSSGISCLALR